MIGKDKYLQRVSGMKAESTFVSEKSSLDRFEEWVLEQQNDVTSLGSFDIEDYLIHLSNKDYSPATIENDYIILKQYYHFLDRRDYISEDVFGDIDKGNFSSIMSGHHKTQNGQNDIIYVTHEEVKKMFDNPGNPALRNELLIRLLWETGIRRGEACDILIPNIDREERSIMIDTRKKHTHRKVFYQPATEILMEQWIDGGYRDSYPFSSTDNLFVTHKNGSIDGRTVNRVVRTAAENAGVQEILYVDNSGKSRSKITAHTMRHGHAVHALKSDIDVRSVQKHLGHSDIEHTMTYLQLVDDDVKEAYGKFDTID